MSRTVIQVIAAHFDHSPEDVHREQHVTRDLAAGDSLMRVELVMALEDEYGFEIPDEDAEPLHTVGQFVDYVEGRLNSAKAA